MWSVVHVERREQEDVRHRHTGDVDRKPSGPGATPCHSADHSGAEGEDAKNKEMRVVRPSQDGQGGHGQDRFWAPASALSTFPGRPYDVWRRAGRFVVTEGTVTDYDQVEAEVIELCREGGVLEVAYDRRFASQMALHLEGAGLTVIDTPRGLR
jgi:hypothetical protein